MAQLRFVHDKRGKSFHIVQLTTDSILLEPNIIFNERFVTKYSNRYHEYHGEKNCVDGFNTGEIVVCLICVLFIRNILWLQ